MRTVLWLALSAALCAAGCRSKPDGSPPPVRSAPKTIDPARAELERLRLIGGFTQDAYMVWGPIWPRRRDEVVVIYDLAAKHAPLAGARELTWILRPEQGPPIERAAKRHGDLAVVRVAASELTPGRFSFRSANRVDDNCGNPPGLPIVDLVPFWE
jgi:hypothetical protein